MAAVALEEPSFSVSAHWTVSRIRNALTAHELGDFAESAKLAEFIRRDPIVFQALDSRVLGMLGLPFCLEPSNEGDQRVAGRVAADVKKWWRKRVRKSQLAKILRWGILLGFAPGTIRWDEDPKTGKTVPRPRVFHPQWARFSKTRIGASRPDGFTLATSKGVVNLEPGDGDFFLFSPGGDDQPWMEGAIRALAIPVLIRSMAERDWARASEIYGMGLKKVKVPADASKDAAIRAFLRDVANLANEPTIKLPEGFDLSVDIVDAGDGKGFEALMNKCEAAIVAVLLGQVLTSQSSGGGSYALGKVAQRTTLDRFEADTENLEEFEEEQILEPYCEKNEGDRTLAPCPSYDTDPPEDKAVLAARLMNVTTAVRTLKDAGTPVDVRALLVAHEIPVLPVADGEAPTRRGQFRDAHLSLGVLTVDEIRADLGLPLLGGERGAMLVGKTGPIDPNAPPPPPAPFPPSDATPPPPPTPATKESVDGKPPAPATEEAPPAAA